VQAVPHSNVDWESYMQQATILGQPGQYNYSQLVGTNGPMVYPAGHAWLYLGLHHLTGGGVNTRLAQHLACGLYILNLALVFRLLLRTELLPPYLLALMSLGATRVRFIAVVQLFNDPVAMLLLHAAINMFLDGHWSLGSVLFSLGVSVKMNILLFAPALLGTYLTFLGLRGTVLQLGVCAGLQVALASPFLLFDPFAYLKAAFQFNRRFLHRETVNFGFLPMGIFVSKWFHVFLLLVHVSALIFAIHYWFKPLSYLKAKQAGQNGQRKIAKSKSNQSASGPWSTKLVVLVLSMVPPFSLLQPFQPVPIQLIFWPTVGYTVGLYVVSYIASKYQGQSIISSGAKSVSSFLLPFFISNFIGICCSRSLHLQFYSWYFYSLHFLLWNTTFKTPVKLLLLRSEPLVLAKGQICPFMPSAFPQQSACLMGSINQANRLLSDRQIRQADRYIRQIRQVNKQKSSC
jgi:alpha-1,3-mannosyltransferase